MVSKYQDWSKDMHNRIPVKDVGCFPVRGGTEYYKTMATDAQTDEDWYEYHVDFLPEELTATLNEGRGGFVSQRRKVCLPRSCPRAEDTDGLRRRLSDLLLAGRGELGAVRPQ